MNSQLVWKFVGHLELMKIFVAASPFTIIYCFKLGSYWSETMRSIIPDEGTRKPVCLPSMLISSVSYRMAETMPMLTLKTWRMHVAPGEA